MSLLSQLLKFKDKGSRKGVHRSVMSGDSSDRQTALNAASGSMDGSSDVYVLSRFRLTIVWAVVLLSVVFLVSRLLWIQVLHPERLIKEGNSRIIRNYKYEPARGLITDRNGKILALSVPVKSVYADAYELNEKKITHDPDLLRKIASILEITPQELFERVQDPKRRHVRLKQYLALNKAQELEKLKLPGFLIQDNYQRLSNRCC